MLFLLNWNRLFLQLSVPVWLKGKYANQSITFGNDKPT